MPSRVELAVPLDGDEGWRDGDEAVLAFRSADVRVRPEDGPGVWPGVVLAAVYLGERIEYVIGLGPAEVRASGPVADPLGKGTPVRLDIPARAIRAWPARR